ncbi:MurR/RpiR family transcriptional regulator [Clostridium tyrobutyricum]|uniref:MurR/RpiR family transcriptional regulator n=2 Tax=Clostridium tyrobutyricum TaxID=1519 RepID=UPI0002FF744C|nr:SIS domain-containing protein [Clostridium tyrobutyricum]
MISSMAKQDDVIMAFSNSDSNKELIDAIKIGIKNGVKVISITGNAKSPISKVSNIVLVSYGRKSSFRSEAMQC